MPELPEVEIIRRELEPLLVGNRIVEISSRSQKVLRGDPQEILNREISSIQRRGKILILTLDDGKKIAIHLRLTGQLLLVDESGTITGGGHPAEDMLLPLPSPSTRLTVRFTTGTLYFNDQRRFGYFSVLQPGEEDPLLQKMGPEPLSSDLTPAYLEELYQKKKRTNVKAFLLDQENIAGIGNIYADETLFLSGINPRKKLGDIPKEYLPKFLQNIRHSLERGLQFGGVTYRIYSDREEFERRKEEQLYVYGRTGKPCKVCKTPIEKTKVAGRGTHYCPRCQG